MPARTQFAAVASLRIPGSALGPLPRGLLHTKVPSVNTRCARSVDQVGWLCCVQPVAAAGRQRWAREEAQELDDIVEWNNQLVEKRRKEADDAAIDAERLQ